MTSLNATARATLRRFRVTPDEWARANYSTNGTWHGDICGCPDDRCANGFHHMRADDCGCLTVLLELYLSGEGGGFCCPYDLIGPGTDRLTAIWGYAEFRARRMRTGAKLTEKTEQCVGDALRCLAPAFAAADLGHHVTLTILDPQAANPGFLWTCTRCKATVTAFAFDPGRNYGNAATEPCKETGS